MSAGALTNQEKILLHLFDYNRHAEDYVAPPEVTQEGIAKAVGIRRQHVTQYARPLIGEEVVAEETKHVDKRTRRLKVYFLTPRGRMRTASLRDALLKEVVRFRRQGGDTEDVRIVEIFQEHRRGSSLLEILEEHGTLGYVSETVRQPEEGVFDFTEEAPELEAFFGRERETELVLEAIETGRSVVVTGIAGMGKTTLGAKICDVFRGERSLIWRQVRPWDSSLDLALRLATLLKALGRAGLHGYLTSSRPKDMARVEELLISDFAGVNSLLVYDDVHDASAEAEGFLSILERLARARSRTSVLLLSREYPRFYSRREVVIDQSVVEVSLGRLDDQSSRLVLADSGIQEDLLGSLASLGGGNPLFLKLIARTGSGEISQGMRTLETYISEEIEPSLGQGELACLEVGSFYQTPVPSEGMLLAEDATRRSLRALQKKGLLDDLGAGRLTMHSSLADYFQRSLSRARRVSLAADCAKWLHERAGKAVAEGNPGRAITYLQNAVVIETIPDQRIEALEVIGELRMILGDYPGAIDSFHIAMETSEDVFLTARLHQRVAAAFNARWQFDEARAEVSKGMELLPPGPSPPRAWLIWQSIGIAYSEGDFDKAVEELEDLSDWILNIPEDLTLTSNMEYMWGIIHLFDPDRYDPSAAKERLERAIDGQHALGDNSHLSRSLVCSAIAARGLGDLSGAFALLDEAQALADETGSIFGQRGALFVKARYLAECIGDFATSEDLYERAYEAAKISHQEFRLIWFHRHLADLYRWQGRLEEAEEQLTYFLEKADPYLTGDDHSDILSLRVRLSVASADRDSAERHLQVLEKLDKHSPSDSTRFHVLWARAIYEADGGHNNEAKRRFEEARVQESPPHHGTIVQEFLVTGGHRGEFLMDYGRFLTSLGDVVDARGLLLDARRTLRAQCRTWQEDEVSYLLDRLSRTGREKPTPGSIR